MQSWHTTYLGLRELPREISTFELQSFFTYSRTERELINARRSNAHKLGLALHIGFLRLSGRLLNSVRIVPTTLWRHLGDEIGITAVELASLRALYVRGRTLFDHQQLACDVLGFHWMTEHQRRALVRTLRDEVARCADRDQLLVFARRWLYQSKILILRDRDIRVLVTAALGQLEEETAKTIAASVLPEQLVRWRDAMAVDADRKLTIGGADEILDYLKVVHVFIRRPHSSGDALHQAGQAHRGDYPPVGLPDEELFEELA